MLYLLIVFHRQFLFCGANHGMKMLLANFGDGKPWACKQRAVFESLNGFKSFEDDWRVEGFNWNSVDGRPVRFVGSGVDIGLGGDFEESVDGALTNVVVK